MNRDRESSSKSNKNNNKKNDSSSDKTFSGFLKRQNDLVSDLKVELQNSIAEKQQIKFAAMDRNKCIFELQKSIEMRDAEIKKLESELSAAREENTKTLHDFYIFKEKFFELETHYDTESQKQERMIEILKQQEMDTARELTQHCDQLSQQLHEQKQAHAKLGLDYAELKEKFEKNQQEFLRQQKHFEAFKQQMEAENRAYREKMTNDLNVAKQELFHRKEEYELQCDKWRNELLEKDDLIKQCIKDKDIVEEEKNRKIQELKYKISQIEKVFEQPTKSVIPMVSIPCAQQIAANNQDNVKTSQNVAVTKPQLRTQDAETVASSKNEESLSNKSLSVETSARLRPKKIPRPAHMSGHNGNVSTNSSNNKKRINMNDLTLLRNPSPPPSINRRSFCASSTGDDEDDDICIPQWGPKRYVPETETDASEGFFQPKRSKK